MNKEKQVKRFAITSLVIFIVFVLFIIINIKKSNQEFYKLEFQGRINNIRHNVKGFYDIKVEGEFYSLFVYGACIDKLEPGDGIIKKKESYNLLVKHLSSDEYCEYNCFRNR